MEIDVASALGLVRRRVRNFEKDGKPASTVTLTRLYDTGVDDLWDALTNKERIPRWFLPVEGFGRATAWKTISVKFALNDWWPNPVKKMPVKSTRSAIKCMMKVHNTYM